MRGPGAAALIYNCRFGNANFFGHSRRHDPLFMLYLVDHPLFPAAEVEQVDTVRSGRLQLAAVRLEEPPTRMYRLYRICLRLPDRPSTDYPVLEMLFLPKAGRAVLHQPPGDVRWVKGRTPSQAVRNWLSTIDTTTEK